MKERNSKQIGNSKENGEGLQKRNGNNKKEKRKRK